MKPAPFEYQAPATLREAIDLLVSDPEATVIAGGQSLIPVLAFRLAAPSMLVDLRRVPGLGNIAVGESGVRRYGFDLRQQFTPQLNIPLQFVLLPVVSTGI
jgi:carbon-monoxide dehydrogenase medium subunit